MKDWRENVPLSERTTLAVGGPARYHAVAHDEAELSAILREAARRELPTLILGGGSNLLVSDCGFDGVVVEYAADRIDLHPNGSHVRVDCQAGAVWDHLVERAVSENLAGIECLSGIPGRVGAAPIQNIGAYGQEVASVVESARVMERHTGQSVELPAAECGFAYRWSRFKGEWQDRYVITSLRLRLEKHGQASMRYADLKRRFPEMSRPALGDVRQAVLEIRRTKSMVYDREDPNHRSAGSFFMNPVVAPEQAEEVVALAGVADMPRYPAPAGRVKLSAAWLIERAGFPRGYVHGAVGLSSKHTLALINRGEARAADLVELARHIRATVRRSFGVTLHPEPIFAGFGHGLEELLEGDRPPL
ncbi:MAG: UDP-N-acetylmuramate dehydrogenase [Candidatus Eremiobacterota bacterium]